MCFLFVILYSKLGIKNHIFKITTSTIIFKSIDLLEETVKCCKCFWSEKMWLGAIEETILKTNAKEDYLNTCLDVELFFICIIFVSYKSELNLNKFCFRSFEFEIWFASIGIVRWLLTWHDDLLYVKKWLHYCTQDLYNYIVI